MWQAKCIVIIKKQKCGYRERKELRERGGGALGERSFRYDSTWLIVVHVQLLHTQIIVAQVIAL